MKIRFTRPALQDLDAILEYICARSPQGARRVHTRIQAVLALLEAHPRIGVQTTDPTIRRINTAPYPYLIFYEIEPEYVTIHAIRHSARDPSSMPGADA